MSVLVTTAVDDALTELTPLVGRQAACAAVGLARATSYRRWPASPERHPGPGEQPAGQLSARARGRQPRALTDAERAAVLAELHGRFADASPATVYATLLGEGRYLASESTMYRLLRELGETGERPPARGAPGQGQA